MPLLGEKNNKNLKKKTAFQIQDQKNSTFTDVERKSHTQLVWSLYLFFPPFKRIHWISKTFHWHIAISSKLLVSLPISNIRIDASFNLYCSWTIIISFRRTLQLFHSLYNRTYFPFILRHLNIRVFAMVDNSSKEFGE